ncbi:hypothetical protein [Comamonas sp. 26]|uniref:hypothetical protein n=1 Tax=Comamonas sp. 26 TaxID=2035201 RepID=UPI000C188EC4|nr:hypothetical protein [Comamonas sp. 26]PIG09612.1 hypothetical protein CLU84_2542 [Comamonas sp. 26]
MKDTDLRGELLNVLYENRRDEDFVPSSGNFSFPFSDDDILSIAMQLNEHGLVNAKATHYLGSKTAMHYCHISALGIDTVESGSSPNLRINLVPQQNITISGSSNVIVGNNNKQSVNHSVQELARVIDSSTATPEQKEEAKGLLKKFLEHPLLTAVASGAVGLLG